MPVDAKFCGICGKAIASAKAKAKRKETKRSDSEPRGRKSAPTLSLHQIQDELDALTKRAKSMVSFALDGRDCPICGWNKTTSGCASSSQVTGEKVIYGVYCAKKRSFYPQGEILIPKDLKAHL